MANISKEERYTRHLNAGRIAAKNDLENIAETFKLRTAELKAEMAKKTPNKERIAKLQEITQNQRDTLIRHGVDVQKLGK